MYCGLGICECFLPVFRAMFQSKPAKRAKQVLKFEMCREEKEAQWVPGRPPPILLPTTDKKNLGDQFKMV